MAKQNKSKAMVKSKRSKRQTAYGGYLTVPKPLDYNPFHEGQVVRRQGAPKIESTPSGIRVRNCELGRLVGGSTAAPGSLSGQLNPASANFFTWLSGLATSFSRYRWHKLRVIYSSEVGTDVGGSITIGTFYDSSDLTAWIGLGQGTNALKALTCTTSATSGPVYVGNIRPGPDGRMISDTMIEIDVREIHKRVPWLLVGVTADNAATVNQYAGTFIGLLVSQLGYTTPLTLNIGQLWIDYDVELIMPQSTLVSTFAERSTGKSPWDWDDDMTWGPPTGGPKPPTQPKPSANDEGALLAAPTGEGDGSAAEEHTEYDADAELRLAIGRWKDAVDGAA